MLQAILASAANERGEWDVPLSAEKVGAPLVLPCQLRTGRVHAALIACAGASPSTTRSAYALLGSSSDLQVLWAAVST